VGDDLNTIVQFLEPGATTYSAVQVVETLLSKVAAEEPAMAATA